MARSVDVAVLALLALGMLVAARGETRLVRSLPVAALAVLIAGSLAAIPTASTHRVRAERLAAHIARADAIHDVTLPLSLALLALSAIVIAWRARSRGAARP